MPALQASSASFHRYVLHRSPHGTAFRTSQRCPQDKACRRRSTVQPQATQTLEQPPAPQTFEKVDRAAGYNWSKQWYAVACAIDVDKDRPYPFTLCGQPIVIWHDGNEWRCAEDRCPHRAAPLSEGKVWSDGSLMCSYHGWRFKGEDGSCVAIPQAASQQAEAAACANRRSCASVRPIREEQGLLFVWGESGPAAAVESAAAPLPLVSRWGSAQKLNVSFKPYHRDLPYDYQTLVENVADPAHVPFSHHKVQGNRDSVNHGDYELRRVDSDNPFIAGPASIFDNVEFVPPAAIAYNKTRDDGTWSCFATFLTPTTPGNSRIVAASVNTNTKVPLFLRLLSLWPRWLEHVVIRHTVLDGDSVFLHMQEHKLVEEARQQEAEAKASSSGDGVTSAWQRLYFMPAASDVLVAAFKKWLDSKAGGGPYGPLHAAAGYPPLISDRRVLLDRWHAHTVHCSSCRKAFASISLLRNAAAAAATVAFGASLFGLLSWAAAGSSQATTAMALTPTAWSAVGGAVLALAWRMLSKLRDLFIFRDYHHWAQ